MSDVTVACWADPFQCQPINFVWFAAGACAWRGLTMSDFWMQFWIVAVVAVGVVVFIFLHIDDEGSGGW
jgi:hypothetical protein